MLSSGQDHDFNRAVVLGTGPLALDLLQALYEDPGRRGCIAGVLTEHPSSLETFAGYPVLGTFASLQRIINDVNADRVIVAITRKRGHLPIHQLVDARISKGLAVDDGDELYEKLTGKVAVESLTPSSLIFSKDYRPSAFQLATARVISLVLALAGLLLLGPLLLLIALAIKLDSGGSIFFIQERVGLYGRRFRLLKFRTMHPVDRRVSEWVRDNGHRITRIGKYLRKYRLDELPQFINVLRGDMNLVGPRPHPASNFELLVLVSRNTPECGGQIPCYSLRSLVRPGITGWAQVRYRYANDINEEIEKIRFDLYYVKHYSVWLDLRILLETVKVVVLGREAAETGTPGTQQS